MELVCGLDPRSVDLAGTIWATEGHHVTLAPPNPDEDANPTQVFMKRVL